MDTIEEKAETRTEYVVRRAREVKRYRENAQAAGVGEAWLCKLVRSYKPIKRPSAEMIDKCFEHYKRLEAEEQRVAEQRERAAIEPELSL